MADLLLALASAFWLGILTSISPCPMGTNIAAISFVGRRVDKPYFVLSAGVLYTAGRMLVYTGLGVLLSQSLLSAPGVSDRLQTVMNQALGPILVLVGMVLLNLLSLNFNSKGVSETLQSKVEQWGLWGAGFLGILFALSFCPTSAALFFGSLIPLALKQQSGVLVPACYGLATGLPVLIFAFVMALGANRLGALYQRTVQFECWARRITGVCLTGVGIYYCLKHNFHIL